MHSTAGTDQPAGSLGWFRWLGLFAGPVLALLVYLLLPQAEGLAGGLTPAGRATAAVGVLMAVWWLSEALPIEATSLVPLALFPLLGVLPIREAAAPYANPLIFLFLGGLMLGVTMERWGLHRRIALITISIVGAGPMALVAGVMLATALLSMWVSNTATAVMMLPIGMSIAVMIAAKFEADPSLGAGGARAGEQFGTCLMLAIAYAASIGGVGTLVGTPPNIIFAAVAQEHGVGEVSFGRWLRLGLPIVAIFLPVCWLFLTRVMYRVPVRPVPGVRAAIRAELAALGRMSRGEWTIFIVFCCTALAWVLREPLGWRLGLIYQTPAGARVELLTDPGIAMIAALSLFAIPINARRREFALTWRHAVKVPWGVLLLFGGGLSLAEAMSANGVDTAIGGLFGGLAGLHPLLVVLAVATAVVFLTEVTSNTAVATTFMLIVLQAAISLGIHPFLLMVPTALAASYAFMMPMGTPPNAVVFASGRVTIAQMARTGLALNLAAVVLISLFTYALGPWLLGFERTPP